MLSLNFKKGFPKQKFLLKSLQELIFNNFRELANFHGLSWYFQGPSFRTNLFKIRQTLFL